MNSLTSLLDRLDEWEKGNRQHSLKQLMYENARPLISAMREMHMALEFYAGETIERVGKMFGDKEKR